MFKNDLKRYVESHPKLVSRKSAGEGLYVLKYKKTVFFDNLWNQYLEECRGTIVDEKFDVVSRPFTKIYNFGVESKAPKLAEDVKVTAFRKVNGFMVAVTHHQDDILVSTTGSTTSDYVAMARELIDVERYRKVCRDNPRFTFMFECVHERDPHIIPEPTGMYLLGYRFNEWDSQVLFLNLESIAEQFGCLVPERLDTTVGELVKLVKTVRHEGFVAYTDDRQAFKIKSPYYLVNKFVARNPRTDKLMKPDVKRNLDEEYYDLIDHIQANIVEYTALTEQDRLQFVRNFLSQ